MGTVLARQRDRWILWLPVGVVTGAAAWAAAPRDPPLWVTAAALVAGVVLATAFAAWPSDRPDGMGARARAVLAAAFALIGAFALGALAAHARASYVDAPRLAAPLEGVQVIGWVAALEGGARPRMRVLVRSIEGVTRPPPLVRISVRPGAAIGPGRAIACRASLRPPDGPLAPGAYDFARRAYFMRLSAVGYAWGRCRPIIAPLPANVFDRAALWIGAVRNDVSERVQEASPGRGGAIAAALIAGDESAVDDETNQALRDSGLGHILSVSGLHMGIVGGGVFAALVIVLSLIGPLALRVSVRKIAAGAALIVLAAYLVLSGSSVPAVRAYVMAAVAFGAILIDRPALTMRGLALALLIVTLIFPESVLEPGFQMSFAATAALVAAFEANAARITQPLPSPGPIIGGLENAVRALGAILLTSLVAGLATDPFALFHFQRFATYGLVSNLAVAPLVTFVVTPTAGLAALAAPFGLEESPLEWMAQALNLVAGVAAAFGDRPEAVQVFPRPPDVFLPLSAMAIAWGCLWRGWLRLGALAWAGAAIAIYLATPLPAMAIDGEGRALFMRQHNIAGWRMISAGGRSTFARDRLGGQLGIPPTRLESIASPEGCTETLCAWTTPAGRRAFSIATPDAFIAACTRGAIVIARITPPANFAIRCRPALLLTADDLSLRGGALLTETANGLAIARAAPRNVQRPWTPRPLSPTSVEETDQ